MTTTPDARLLRPEQIEPRPDLVRPEQIEPGSKKTRGRNKSTLRLIEAMKEIA